MSANPSSLKLPLSAMTPSGIIEFHKLVSTAPSMSIDEVKQRVHEIARGTSTAKVISKSTEVPLFPDLDTRRHTAELVQQILGNAGIEAGPSSGHEGLFAWLALVFLPSLCKRTSSGSLATGKMYRYIPTRSTTDFYRHLVACPYWLLRRYGKLARIFLCQKAFIMPDVVEQIVSRPTLIDSQGVIELIDRFYWNEGTDSPRAGFTATTRNGDPPPGFARTSPDPGTLRALEWTLGQLQCTYDLRSMTADQIMAKLPAEFEPWLSGTPA